MTPLAVELLAGELILAWRAAGHDRADPPRHLAHETRDLGDGRLRLVFVTAANEASIDIDPALLGSTNHRTLVSRRIMADLGPR